MATEQDIVFDVNRQPPNEIAWRWVKAWVRAGFIRPGCMERLQADLTARLCLDVAAVAMPTTACAPIGSAGVSSMTAVADSTWQPPDGLVDSFESDLWMGVIPPGQDCDR